MNNKIKIFWAMFIGIIMVSSLIGFMYEPSEDNKSYVEYGNNKFYQNENGLWILEKNDQKYYFSYLPDDVKDIELPQISINNQKQYLIYDYEENTESFVFIISKLKIGLSKQGINVVEACKTEENCPSEMPIKDCNSEGFYLKTNNEAKFYKDNMCYVLEGDLQEISKSVDKINYLILGVI